MDGVAPNWMIGVSASVMFPCTMKSRRRFLLELPHPGSPGKRAIKTVVCVCVCVWSISGIQRDKYATSTFNG